MARDTIYKQQIAAIKAFEFDEAVTAVFSDMIERSVPGYRVTLDGIHRMAATFVPAGGRCYDLGCSLGAGILAASMGLGETPAEIIGVDNSAAMIETCKTNTQFDDRRQHIHFQHADIADISLQPADFVIMNYTLQFLPPEGRLELLSNIHDALRPGGALLLSEKFVFDDPVIRELLIDQHHEFKREHDYSDMEIAGKRNALENVLIPDSRETHERRLRAAGFAHVALWQAELNFGSFIAIRADD
ncbi:MAG: carboxy-S-adenosyl-L-methionine synthase CmoA [Pseudomonadota bacterium]